jgi:hypothetical protein
MGDAGSRPMRVLLYSFSTFNISSVPAQITSYRQKLEGWGYEVDDSKDPAVFTDASLAKYAAVGMINNCFEPFGQGKDGMNESTVLRRFLQQGGGLFGTHCADVTFTSARTMPLYNELIGGWAHDGMNSGDNGMVSCRKTADHPTSMMLPATFTYRGNIDRAEIASDVTVLVRCTLGGNTVETPVSWVRTEPGGGRVFFTSFAKEDRDLKDAMIGEPHVFAGLSWVLGR